MRNMNMKSKIFVLRMLSLVFICVFISCQQTVSTTGGDEPYPALKAVTVPKSDTGIPDIIYSWTDGESNIFVCDLGWITNTFAGASAGPAYYDGTHTPTLTATDYNETTVSNALSEILTDSIEVTNETSIGHEEGTETGSSDSLGGEVGGSIKKFLDIKGTYEHVWSTTETSSDSIIQAIANTVGSSRSTETSLETAVTKGKQSSVGFSVVDSDPIGLYRIGVYTIADAYLVVKTSRDNQTLLEYAYVICARDEYFSQLDYTSKGEDFDNTPEAKFEIIDGFWKNLAIPEYNPGTNPSITSITVMPSTASVATGDTQQFTAVVNGTNNPSQMVTWSVSGNASTGTTIADGLLTIGSNETAVALTVMATSVIDDSVSTTVTVTIESGYMVSFDANNGSGTVPSSQTVDIGLGIILPANNLSKDTYIFGGWYDTSSGMTYQPGSYYIPLGNTTFQAKWVLRTSGFSKDEGAKYSRWSNGFGEWVGNWSSYEKMDSLSDIASSIGFDIDALKNDGYNKLTLTIDYAYSGNTGSANLMMRVRNTTTKTVLYESNSSEPNGRWKQSFSITGWHSGDSIIVEVRGKKDNVFSIADVNIKGNRTYTLSFSK
ncbi:MAG: InlB B-repeat-containing protein [Spirochaetaceae bacterium]|jgi:hypothetical protein|nr:InlB B-repeat-containing protein [Spirochaetaceae bacterium]